jgi:hypothetical protein
MLRVLLPWLIGYLALVSITELLFLRATHRLAALLHAPALAGIVQSLFAEIERGLGPGELLASLALGSPVALVYWTPVARALLPRQRGHRRQAVGTALLCLLLPLAIAVPSYRAPQSNQHRFERRRMLASQAVVAAARDADAARVQQALERCGALRSPDNGESPRWLCENVALASAVERGDVALLDALLASGLPVDGHRDAGPLQRAASRADARMVEALLARGANANAEDEAGYSVLRQLCVRSSLEPGHVDVAQRLLAAGADAFAADDRGHPTVHEQCRRSRDEAARGHRPGLDRYEKLLALIEASRSRESP